MTDRMTAEQRHRCMSHIHSKGTKPELKVRKWLWSHGYRYRLNVKSVPGKPDIVMRPYRTAIFVNGCFWHGHGVAEPPVESFEFKVMSSESAEKGELASSRCCKIPKTHREFWEKKIRRNQERDRENYEVLHRNGWMVIVVWECQLTAARLESTMAEVEGLLSERMLALHRPKRVAYGREEEELPRAAEGELSVEC